MKLFTAVACLTFLLGISAYGHRSGGEQDRGSNANTPQSVPGSSPTGSNDAAKQQAETVVNTPTATPTAPPVQTGQPQTSPQATAERKIVHVAEITLEVASPADGLGKLRTMAGAHGGFVVASESRPPDDASGDSQPADIVTVQLRVPTTHFEAALAEIRAMGKRVGAEKQTGKDVNEEYVDLDMRLRHLRAHEDQLLKLLARADTVALAREARSPLDEVRQEIERVEGYQKFPGQYGPMSTINVTLRPTAPDTSGFFNGIKNAFGYGVSIVAVVISAIVRLVALILPMLLIIVLPPLLLWRLFLRFRRQ
jgi:hypothetical protein